YAKSSHQDNPGCTVLDIFLAHFTICTLLQPHTPKQRSMHEVDELVDELTPEPLGSLLTSEEQSDFMSVPMVSGASGPRPKLTNTGQAVNCTGLRIAGNNTIKVRAIETPQRYGVGICGPPGFYGTIGASVCCQCTFTVTNGFDLQMCTWILLL
ncbi:hypothetical protein EDB89DRAFT_1859319, partial [Lactarius sanguifluus]